MVGDCEEMAPGGNPVRLLSGRCAMQVFYSWHMSIALGPGFRGKIQRIKLRS